MSVEKYLSLQRSILSTVKLHVAISTVELANLIYETYHTTARHCTELRRKKILNSWEVNRTTYWSFMTKHQYEAYCKIGSRPNEIHIEQEGGILEA